MKQVFDVIVLGGGIVGLTIATLLGQKKLHVALVDRSDLSKDAKDEKPDLNGYYLRCSAIAREAELLFQSMSIWDHITRLSPYESMHVWEALGSAEIHFKAQDVQQKNLGHIIENKKIQNALISLLSTYANINIFSQQTPKRIDIFETFAQLELKDDVLCAKLIIGADGGNSWLRSQCSIEVKEKDYEQTAMVAVVKTEHSHQKTAWQRFLTTGPLAFLPLQDSHFSSIVWSLPPLLAKEILSLDSNAFCLRLSEAFEFRLGKVLEVGERQCFPLKMVHAKAYCQKRVVFIGDAAHVIHPLAGLGVNLGLQDAAFLAQMVEKAYVLKKDIGELALLRRYERSRKGSVWFTMQLMTFFKECFAKTDPLTTGLRNMGVHFLEKNRFLKKKTIAHAMGLKAY